MSRYDSTLTKKTYKGKQVYLTTYYPSIIYSSSDIYIISSVGDRLDTLSYSYYKDPQYWWILAQANNLGKGSLSIPPGTQIRIPAALQQILSNFNSENQ
jgi:hypothetical protein